MTASFALLALVALAIFAAPVQAGVEPTTFTPSTNPDGSVNGPCGLAVDSNGRFYLSDYYHDKVDVFTGALGYLAQLSDSDSDGGPCGLAVDSTGKVYVDDYHRGVIRYTPSAFPVTPATTYGSPTTIGPGPAGPATGVAVNPATNHLFMDRRTFIAEYDASGTFVQNLASFSDGYGIAVSGYSGTAGNLYVPDAATKTVKVFDSSGASVGSIAPPGGFKSLRDSAVAVDNTSGEIYVVDDTQPENAEQPRARVYVFSSAGALQGHLKYDAVDGAPTGLAVDNSAVNPGRVYVTSGNTDDGGVYVYTPDAETGIAPVAPTIPATPIGGEQLLPHIPIGSAAPPPGGIPCEGDACQVLPSEPVDPTLTTLLEGLGNPKPRYKRYKSHSTHHGHRGQHRHCRRHGKGKRHAACGKRAAASVATTAAADSGPLAAASASTAATGAATSSAPGGSAIAAGLLPGSAGFDAAAWSEGEEATRAGSHPYSLEFSVGLDQGSGEADLRNLRFDLPPGFLINPAAINVLCSNSSFAVPRSSPYEASQSGESCIDRTQVGTVEVTRAGGQTRRFGLFELNPPTGAAFVLAAAPFDQPLVLGGQIRSGSTGTYFSLAATDVPQALQVASLKLTLWGTPWDASHNTERGNCLNEATPSFPWSKCSVGNPNDNRPLAFLTLPTQCGAPLSFTARVTSWQQAGTETASASGPAPVSGCETLTFNAKPDGLLSVAKASSSSGYVFRFSDEDPGLANPRQRIHALTRQAMVELPKGVTLNPSLGAGLQTCSPAQLANESAFIPPGGGCPNGAKIGVFSVRVPFYEGLLRGGIYLAKPYENPFGTLLAVYLVVKSADRGVLITLPGKLVPDPSDGTLTATFDNLPQLPYTDLEVNFRSGQRAPLVSPPSCGSATTKITMTPWASGVAAKVNTTNSPITAGIDFGPCPNGSTPPFSPSAVTGGVNSNVGSYTPYYVHLSRKDTEQEITSYSLTLPKGITGKIAGIPFCPDAAIEAARRRNGFDETASPSCPAASEVGHTLTGYGVGPALTYAPGHIYLAGPYHGAPLSLVTINAATVGPFDLGTIVIRSAFQIDPYTAQLRIDPGASDPIPHIRDGVVLHLRDIRIYMDRFQFTHNPSSCEPSALESTLTGSGRSFEAQADDSTATVAKHFQLLNCLTLGFQPKLGLRLRGDSHRGSFPSLRASFVSRGAKDSNLKRIEVEMPHALFLAQQHIRTVCTRAQFDASNCPAGSIYGKAVAKTLLFDELLRGNVYLRSSAHRFPDLVADLHSGSVHIVVEGEIGPSRQGGFRAFFDNLPDAPIDSFTMTLFGGKRGLLTNSVNICAKPPLASVKGLGQNNVGAIFTSRLRGQCGKKGGKHGKHHRAG